MSKVVIEGRIDIEIEESDSDSESDNENFTHEVTINNPSQPVDDEEEEIEYFGKGNNKVNSNPSDGNNNNNNKSVKSNPIAHQDSTPSNVDEGDSFGITYRPMKSKNTGSAPPPSVFESIDTTEIEKRLLSQGEVADDDDEFGIDEEDNIESDYDSNKHIQAVRHAIEVVAANYSAIQESEDDELNRAIPAEELQKRMAADEPPPAVSDAPQISTEQTSAAAEIGSRAKENILKEAQRALAEVTDVYGSGLGDQEVLLLKSDNSAPAKEDGQRNAMPVGDTQLGVHGGIAEEDEEAAELEESEEEMLERMRKMELEMEQRRVEEEWEKVASEAAPPPPSTVHTDINTNVISVPSINESEDGSSKYMPSLVNTTDDFFGSALDDDDNNPHAILLNNNNDIKTYTKPDDTMVTYNKAMNYFINQDLSIHVANIIVTEPRPKSSWFGLNTPKPINYNGFTSRDLNLPFLIAQIDYDSTVTPMFNMLLSIYNFLLDNTKKNPKMIGNHWEQIGFQGIDPKTDLNRSMKMLSILQMLNFIESDALLVKKLFILSESSSPAPSRHNKNAMKNDKSWPFMCVAIMFTKESLQALRRGDLNDKCNKYKNIFGVLNESYRAIFAEFGRLLEEDPQLHHAIHLNTIRKNCEAVGGVVKIMKKYKHRIAATTKESIAATKKATTITTNNNKVDSSVPMPPMPDPTIKDDLEFDNISQMQEINPDQTADSTAIRKKAAKFQA